jgi:hypothetical protein
MRYIVRVIVVDLGADRSNPTRQYFFFADCCCYYCNYSLERFITIDCFKSVRHNLKVSHRRHIYKHRFISNISYINIRNVYIRLRTKLDILKTSSSAIVKNYNIRAGAILSPYILQNSSQIMHILRIPTIIYHFTTVCDQASLSPHIFSL